MRILALHSDFIEYEITKKTTMAEELPDSFKKDRMEEVLAVFTTVEAVDEDNPHVVEDAASEIADIAGKVNTTHIMIYPYAHLSSTLASPQKAVPILKELEEELKSKGYTAKRSPFGYYKSFSLKCKGHPLSELSRSILPREKGKAREEEEEKKSRFIRFILVNKKGKDFETDPSTWKKNPIWNEEGTDLLKTFVRNELEGNPSKAEKPRHIEYMQRLELVDYTPESDVGNMKWYPNGLLIKDLILDYQENNVARPYGAFKIQNPLLYRTDVPEIKMLMGEFHEKDYRVEDGLVLRFASDPGAFPYMQKVTFSYKHMPIREYEEAICFRKEQKGELSGLRRVRNFLMTDVHAFCMDEEQAKEEYVKLSLLCKGLMDSIISRDRWVLGWEILEQFYEENREWILKLIKTLEVPSLIKIMKERSHYYTLKNEYQSIEADGANSQISTVQMDFVNGERFNITYTGEDGKMYPCIILHCSTFGSIERAVCSILENAAIDQEQGRKPQIPLWLSPTQVRLIPVSERHLDFCISILDDLKRLRADIDDRSETLSSKIRDAERIWVPYICVVGDQELESKMLSVRVRGEGQHSMTVEELSSRIGEQVKGMPFRPLALPVLLSRHPKFR